MTRDETIAFNAGVRAVLVLAAKAAVAIEPKIVTKPTRYNFAHGAILALAEEGRALLQDMPLKDAATDRDVQQDRHGARP